MALTKTIQVDGQDVTLRASAAIPRIYRIKFNRDMFNDLHMLAKAMSTNEEGMSTLDNFSLEVFENIAYVMAKHADPTIPDTPEEWLDRFRTLSIYQVFPKIMELWELNLNVDVEAKKTAGYRARNDHSALPAPVSSDRIVSKGP